MSTRINILVWVWLLLLLASCRGDSKRKAYEEAIMEWTGKEIVFPDSMRLVGGGMISLPESDFTIVSYYDSVGCTGCRLKLPLWQEFMRRVDSVRGDRTVTLLLVAATKDEKELEYLKRRDDFKNYLIVDSEDRLNEINHFPSDFVIQTFLLDRDKKVVTFGNPIHNQGSARLYLSLMSYDSTLLDNDSDDEEEYQNYEHDFGKVKSGEMVSHRFQLINELKDTLKVGRVIPSCDCTSAEISPMIIPPGTPYIADVSFHDTVSGPFIRSVQVNFKNKTSRALRLEVAGTIIN